MVVTMYKLLIVSYVMCSVMCSDDLGPECDTKTLLDRKTSSVMKRDELCTNHICIIRYCPEPNTIWFVHRNKTEECLKLEEIRQITNNTIEFPHIDVYKVNSDGSLDKTITKKRFFTDFRHVTYYNKMMYSSENCSQLWLKGNNAKHYITEDGGLVRETEYATTKIDKEAYVVEFQVRYTRKKKWIVRMLLKILYSKPKDKFNRDIFNAIGMSISCFFLIIVLGIYSMLPKLQNLPGLMLMSYVASMAMGFGVKALQITLQLTNLSFTSNCQILSPTWYYGLLASFFWMNAMSFDIFWIFWATYKAHPRNKPFLRKFALYSLYGFGVPLLIVAFAVTVDIIDLPQGTLIRKPSFDLCFPTSVGRIYIYIPIATLLCCNILLFFLTSIRLCLDQYRLSKLLGSSNSRNTKKEKARFKTYIKLTIVTGITWIVDPIDTIFDVPDWVAYMVNTNIYMGLAIFIIFICNKDVLVALGNK